MGVRRSRPLLCEPRRTDQPHFARPRDCIGRRRRGLLPFLLTSAPLFAWISPQPGAAPPRTRSTLESLVWKTRCSRLPVRIHLNPRAAWPPQPLHRDQGRSQRRLGNPPAYRRRHRHHAPARALGHDRLVCPRRLRAASRALRARTPAHARRALAVPPLAHRSGHVLYLFRVAHEERMMLDRFGAEYEAYMGRTWRLVPRLRGQG